MKSAVRILIAMLVSTCALASVEPQRVLTPTQWREMQLTDAQNRVIRLANRITNLRNSTGRLDQILRLEKERKTAAHSAELIGEFTIEDYFNMYLSQFSENEDKLVEIAQVLSKEEVAQLLKLFSRRVTSAINPEPLSPTLTGFAIRSDQGI